MINYHVPTLAELCREEGIKMCGEYEVPSWEEMQAMIKIDRLQKKNGK